MTSTETDEIFKFLTKAGLRNNKMLGRTEKRGYWINLIYKNETLRFQTEDGRNLSIFHNWENYAKVYSLNWRGCGKINDYYDYAKQSTVDFPMKTYWSQVEMTKCSEINDFICELPLMTKTEAEEYQVNAFPIQDKPDEVVKGKL